MLRVDTSLVSTKVDGSKAAGNAARRQRRRLLGAGIGLLLALGASLLLASRFLTDSFVAIEAVATELKAHQLLQALNTELRQLAISARDYAEWDSAADFATGANPAFLDGNFTRATMSAMHADLVWIVDRSGADLYSGHYDPRAREFSVPAPKAVLGELRRVMSINPAINQRPPAERMLNTSRGPMGFTVYDMSASSSMVFFKVLTN